VGALGIGGLGCFCLGDWRGRAAWWVQQCPPPPPPPGLCRTRLPVLPQRRGTPAPAAAPPADRGRAVCEQLLVQAGLVAAGNEGCIGITNEVGGDHAVRDSAKVAEEMTAPYKSTPKLRAEEGRKATPRRHIPGGCEGQRAARQLPATSASRGSSLVPRPTCHHQEFLHPGQLQARARLPGSCAGRAARRRRRTAGRLERRQRRAAAQPRLKALQRLPDALLDALVALAQVVLGQRAGQLRGGQGSGGRGAVKQP